jgi:hypothetical protein
LLAFNLKSQPTQRNRLGKMRRDSNLLGAI